MMRPENNNPITTYDKYSMAQPRILNPWWKRCPAMYDRARSFSLVHIGYYDGSPGHAANTRTKSLNMQLGTDVVAVAVAVAVAVVVRSLNNTTTNLNGWMIESSILHHTFALVW